MTHLNRFNIGSLVPATVGFDRFFDALESLEKSSLTNFPPHNIVKLDDNNYLVEIAVAGFSQDEINVEVLKGELTITGKKNEDDNRSYLHRGIGTRSFKKMVRLADTVQVVGAAMEDGILSVRLENVVPEEKLPKRIPIVNTKVVGTEGNKKLLQE